MVDLGAAMTAGKGRNWTEFVKVPGDEALRPMHWRLLDGARVEVPGSVRPWRACLLPVESPGEQPLGFQLLLVSEERLPDEEPAEPDTGGAKAHHAGRGLIGRDIAPVLRQPIARIVANAETIRTRLAGPLADEYANYAADIAAAGQHLLGLLDDLSDLEVVESDGFRTAHDHIDLAEVARQAAGILAVRASENDIIIDAPKSGESLPAIGEFRRVLQILINLLGNAIRYAPAGSQVWIRLEDEGERARIIVADQGPGMSEDEQARVFEKFERLGRSGDGGSGLGLYISRRLARAMDGELTVESAPGQGARFVLDIPADLGQEIADEDQPDLGGIAHLPLRLPRIPVPRPSDGDGSGPPDGDPGED
jgi:signal transduction histidine kinase